MSQRNQSSAGISATFLLFVVFLVLKLTHYIDWSWWWITAPLWIPYSLIMLFGFIVITFKVLFK